MGRREMAVSFRLGSPHHRSPDDFDEPTLVKQSKVVSLMRSKHPGWHADIQKRLG